LLTTNNQQHKYREHVYLLHLLSSFLFLGTDELGLKSDFIRVHLRLKTFTRRPSCANVSALRS
jgi:hypothetical protein